MFRLLDMLARRWFALSAFSRDVTLAAVLTVGTQVELQAVSRVQGSMAVQAASFAMMTSSVAWRRRAPLVAAIVASVGLIVQTIDGEAPVVGGFIALLVVTYSTGTARVTNRAILGGIVLLCGVLSYAVVSPERTSVADEIGNAAIFVGAWLLGRIVRLREGRADELEQKASHLQAAREEDVREAVQHERARIARELHDIVAHGLSLMTLHAGAARQVLEQDTAAARTALANIEETGRRSLEEMHRLLVILREDGAAGADRTPPATLDQVHLLADRTRGARLDVEVVVDGAPRRLPQGLEASAYRIIQEALTNVLKHSTATRVEVTLAYLDDALEVTINDNGVPTRAASRGLGHGLIGMRERVSVFGGSISTGASPTGGWEVRAVLPSDSSP
ncbi:MAG TPA: sensor histidine kinase [Actinomycetota bacterium]|nr:sensor histidine kinase [Actinomycetota bacterium]